ncbi:MAG: 50S ribosomal protein L3 [Clostridiales bacterium]|jgi:large subunit ribosomal protein L3|nr:50S ribosomal protein L3 [Clostridiales bacterium]
MVTRNLLKPKKAILGRKIGMTQVFAENGELVPVTVIEAGPCVVVQKKTVENDGYAAIKVAFKDARTNKRGNVYLNKPDKGQFDKAGLTAYKKYLREFRLEDVDSYEVGAEITADIFAEGDKVDVTGTSKGKGFQGAIKRHNYGRGPESHGSKHHRALGSMGPGTTPARVRKGKPMAGHMGNERVTVANLTVVRADGERNLLLVKGAVPGPRGSLVSIKNTTKNK